MTRDGAQFLRIGYSSQTGGALPAATGDPGFGYSETVYPLIGNDRYGFRLWLYDKSAAEIGLEPKYSQAVVRVLDYESGEIGSDVAICRRLPAVFGY